MSQRTLLVWLLIAAASLAGAIAVGLSDASYDRIATVDRPAMPGLVATPEAVAGIEIVTADETISLELDADGQWVAADVYDYPAAADRIRTLIVDLANLRILEPRTERPDRHERLGVGRIGTDPEARLVRVMDAVGGVLDELIIGRRGGRVPGTVIAGLYVRSPADDRSWLAAGTPNLGTDVADWLEPTAIDIPRAGVRRVVARPQVGSGFVASRDVPDGDLALVNPPADRAINDSRLLRLASMMTDIGFEDVRPRDDFVPADLGLTPAGSVILTTFDGLEVSADLFEGEERYWATFTANRVPTADETAPMPEEAFDALDRRIAAWAFGLPDFAAERLTPTLDDLLLSDGES